MHVKENIFFFVVQVQGASLQLSPPYYWSKGVTIEVTHLVVSISQNYLWNKTAVRLGRDIDDFYPKKQNAYYE